MFTKMNLFSKWAYASVKNHPSSSENYAGQVGGTRPLVAVLLLFLLSCSACSDTKPQTDSDNDSSLSDSDSDLVADSDSPNTDRDTDAEVLEVPDYDCDILPDYDFLTDEDQEPVCLSLKDRDNVRKAGFPFKDDSGQVHFCRKGCDTPTENDPHCVRNLWEWSNFGIYTHYKASQTCYPWPCKMTMKPYYYPETSVMWETHMCDIQVSPKEWSTSVGIVRDLELYKDRAGLHLGTWAGEEYPGMIITEYNVKDETFHQIGNAVQAGYDNDRFIFEATDANYQRDQNYNSYIISASGSGTNYKYEVIYTDKEYQSAFTYPPIVGEKWVVIQIKHKAISLNTGYVLYAKVGEWKWTVLTEGLIYDGNIVDNRLTYHDMKGKAFLCNLDKQPQKQDDCMFINRPNEEIAANPKLDVHDSNRLIYHPHTANYLVHVDLSKTPPEYKEYPVKTTEDTTWTYRVDFFRGNTVLYGEMYYLSNGDVDSKTCFYRLDTETSYCPKSSYEGGEKYDMLFSSFNGRYILWKTSPAMFGFMRDMKCYCEKKGNEYCPVDEYMLDEDAISDADGV